MSLVSADTNGFSDVFIHEPTVAAPPPPAPPPARCVVPNVRWKKLAVARRSITAARCRVGRVRHARSKRVRPGRVISQSARARTRARVGFARQSRRQPRTALACRCAEGLEPRGRRGFSPRRTCFGGPGGTDPGQDDLAQRAGSDGRRRVVRLDEEPRKRQRQPAGRLGPARHRARVQGQSAEHAGLHRRHRRYAAGLPAHTRRGREPLGSAPLRPVDSPASLRCLAA